MYMGLLSALALPMTLLAQERSWTERYPEEVAAANRACTAKEFIECRRHLLRLKELVDGRGDIIYGLAKVEASLGSVGAAIDWLSIYSRMGLQLADPATDPAFADLKDGPDFQRIVARLKTGAAPTTASRCSQRYPKGI